MSMDICVHCICTIFVCTSVYVYCGGVCNALCVLLYMCAAVSMYR